MTDSFTVSALIPASPERVYQAWMDGEQHGWMTGGSAEIDPQVGGAFSVWDQYITGKTLELEPYRRIVQAWRTSEFPADAPDSQLEVVLDPAPSGTMLTLNHSNIPDGQGKKYEHGWVESYFEPMREYFTSLAES